MTTTTTTLTIHLTVAAAPGAPRVPLEISSEITAGELRRQASQATKIPLAALKLIFRGRMVVAANDDDDEEATRAVTEYKLEDGSVLHCMGKPLEDAAPGAATTTTTDATAASSSSGTNAATLPSVNLIPPAAAASSSSLDNLTVPGAAGDPLAAALQTMRANNPPPVFKTAVETLQKLLAKIVENPLEEKYRRVKKENPAFARKLGALPGGDAAMKGAGFVVQTDDESGQAIYQMVPSPDAWPKLLQAQTTIANAVREAQTAAAAPLVPPAMPGLGSTNPGGGMAGMPDMSQAAANLMQNPQALEAMLQNPIVQNMMRNDPRFANNPMARQMMETLFRNPAAVQQSMQMMQDPTFQQQMQLMQQNPAMMAQLAQMQNMFGGGAVAGAAGGVPSLAPASSQSTQPQQQQQQGNQQSDTDATEEEMIAEAIRRSLQDNNNNNN